MFAGLSPFHLLIMALPLLLLLALAVLVYAVIAARRQSRDPMMATSVAAGYGQTDPSEQRLAEVDELFQRGVINDAERTKERARILAG